MFGDWFGNWFSNWDGILIVVVDENGVIYPYSRKASDFLRLSEIRIKSKKIDLEKLKKSGIYSIQVKLDAKKQIKIGQKSFKIERLASIRR